MKKTLEHYEVRGYELFFIAKYPTFYEVTVRHYASKKDIVFHISRDRKKKESSLRKLFNALKKFKASGNF